MACALVTLITTPASAATSGSRLWVHRDNGGGAAAGSAIVSSPDGADVFVAGEITSSDGQDFLTEADSASTGRQLWVRRYAGPSGGNDAANAIAVSPNGSAVFVTGLSAGANGALDVLTIAYAADTGDRLWSQRYRAPGTNGSQAVALSVSPDGSELFATGSVTRRGRYPDYLTIAYDVPTGSVRWLRRYQGTGHGDDDATAIVAGPGGRTVFVTGESQGPVNFDFATVAYATSGGRTRWVRRYDDPGHAYDDATAIGVDPHGSTVFVTGNGGAATARAGIETIGYRTADGATVWRSRYHGPFGAEGRALAVSPDGHQVFIAGIEGPSQTKPCVGDESGCWNATTLAYDATSGSRMWVRRFDDGSDDVLSALAVAPDGSKVFATGTSYPSSYLTLAFESATGTRSWSAMYPRVGGTLGIASAVAADPDGSRVFVTGQSTLTGPEDATTVAYVP